MLSNKENDYFFLNYKVKIRVATASGRGTIPRVEIVLTGQESSFSDRAVDFAEDISSWDSSILPIRFEYLKEHFPTALETLINGMVMEANYSQIHESRKEVLEKNLINRQTRAIPKRIGKNKKGRPKTTRAEAIEFGEKVISTLEQIELKPEQFKGEKKLSPANVAKLIYSAANTAEPEKLFQQKLKTVGLEFENLKETYFRRKKRLLQKNADNKSD